MRLHSSRLPASFLAVLMPLLGGSLALATGAAAQSVPGFQVSTYADVPKPSLLAFAPDGTLYTGADAVPAGSADPLKVNRIGPGGAPVTLHGNVATSDPDTVVVDVEGAISGVPGTVIVSGLLGSSSIGRISGIHPDGTVVTLFDNGSWANVVEMKFDHAGRFLFTALESRSIWVSTGGPPTILATLPGSAMPRHITIDAANRIVVSGSDNVIRIYNPNGTLANGAFATVSGVNGLEYAHGGAFGSELYALDSVAGTLVRLNAAGVKTVVGTDFPTGLGIRDLAFGPSGELFVAVITQDKVLRISSAWTSLGSALAGVSGNPALAGSGTLAAASVNTIALSLAKPSAVAGLFIGLSSGSIPFKGGILKPAPFFGPVMLATDPTGSLNIPFLMPAGLPAGTSLVFQWAIQDAAAVQGVALSNAVKGLTP